MRPLLLLALAACAAEPTTSDTVQRVHVTGDVYRYSYVVPVGDTPNARLVIHRLVSDSAMGRTDDSIMLLHGDFATFASSFGDGLAPWLAERGVDVWGVDRRATGSTGDLSDFGAMGLEQELADLRVALAFARQHSDERLTLAGFSRGGQLAYAYASREALVAAPDRHVKALVPLDVYASLAAEDADIRDFFCAWSAEEDEMLARGIVEVSNVFQQSVGERALTDPQGTSPWIPTRTNRAVMLAFVGRTWAFGWPAAPVYHLAAPVFGPSGPPPIGLRVSSEASIAGWLAAAPPFAALRESADTDGLLCDPTRFDVPLSRIRIPLFAIAAAGGYGERVFHSTAQVSSADVSTLLIRQLPVEREAEDFGHADLLFAPDAPTLAWQPLLDWLQAH